MSKLLGWPFAVFVFLTGTGLFAADPVTVEKGEAKIARRVIITRTSTDDEFNVSYTLGKSMSDFGVFEKDTVAITSEGVGKLSRKPDRLTYVLEIVEGSKAEVSILLNRKIYAVNATSELGSPTPSAAPPPIPWADFIVPKIRTISKELRTKALHASVRVITPGGVGSGTIVELPTELKQKLKASLEEGEDVVIGASHVTPEYLKSAALLIDVFTYEGESAKSYTRLPARLLFTRKTDSEPDVAVLAVKIPATLEFTRMPIATDRHWYLYDTDYLQIGCPDGKDPILEVSRAVQADFKWKGGSVTMQKASQKGQSGGGLISPDGYLVGVLSATGEASELSTGIQLVSVDEPSRLPKFRGKVNSASSSFYRPNGIVADLLDVEALAQDNRSWQLLRIPVRSEFGLPKQTEIGLAALRADLKLAVSKLPADKREKVIRDFEAAFQSYEAALLK